MGQAVVTSEREARQLLFLFFSFQWEGKHHYGLRGSKPKGATSSTLEFTFIYILLRKEPLYNPRWPPTQRGLLLANTRREAPPWLMARDGMIYWVFCLFALQHNEHTVPTTTLPLSFSLSFTLC